MITTETAPIHSKDKSKAIINGEIVRIGSILKGGAIIDQIGQNYVIIREGSSLRQLVIEVEENSRPVPTPAATAAAPEESSRQPAGGSSEEKAK